MQLLNMAPLVPSSVEQEHQRCSITKGELGVEGS
jgi:hypothetical protein